LGVALPSLLNLKEGPKITLGLDLQGGMYMLLGVELDKAVEAKVKSVASGVRNYAQKQDILVESLSTDQKSLHVTLMDSEDTPKMKTFLANYQGFIIQQQGNIFSLTMSDTEVATTKEFAVNQAVETIRNRLDQFGLAEPSVTKVGADKIHIELPGIKTQAEEQRARDLIARSAHLEMRTVDEERASRVGTMTPMEASSLGDVILPDYQNPKELYLVKDIPLLDGAQLADARVAYDQNNQPVISFTLTADGAEIFGDFTGKNVGTRLAIALDDKIYSAPVIRERIGGGSGQISGAFTVQEASDLAIALRSGALSAPVVVLEKRTVGPTLGADSIKSSLIALLSGGILVVFFMIFYYRYAGVVAVTAMVVNIILIVAVMALFGATLTLPGMAGIVLDRKSVV
jgi:preprotein translocase subunit SecD